MTSRLGLTRRSIPDERSFRKQLSNPHPQRLRQIRNYGKRGIPLPPLDPPDVGPVLPCPVPRSRRRWRTRWPNFLLTHSYQTPRSDGHGDTYAPTATSGHAQALPADLAEVVATLVLATLTAPNCPSPRLAITDTSVAFGA